MGMFYCTHLSPSPCLTLTIFSTSFRRRGRSRRRLNTTSSEPKLETVIDLSHLTPIKTTFQSYIRRFVSSGRVAYHDLQTLLTLDHNRRVVISCRPSTLHFLATSAALTFLSFSLLRVLVSMFGSWRRNASTYKPLVRRDRSLGGKEVVVSQSQSQSNNLPKVQAIPSSAKKKVVRFQKKLPTWWPTVINRAVIDVDEQQEYKREACRVVRAIINSRLGGNDILDTDIIQLRQLCRTSGVRVSIEPTNVRDTLYRTSVNFVLNACSSAPTHSTSVDIYGEDAKQFLAGFAENIGLENVRAATIVSAAVAARTRSCLLQAWALEIQGKHVDALAELSKICLLLQNFPPEESSPEMEMVSRGLEKHLKLEQRQHLMFLFGKVCGEDSHRIAREALGLMHSQSDNTDQLEDNIAS